MDNDYLHEVVLISQKGKAHKIYFVNHYPLSWQEIEESLREKGSLSVWKFESYSVMDVTAQESFADWKARRGV